MSTAITYPKRLIEVDLPIRRISNHARREKSIRHGHISTLHIWWARRPLAACRAVICAALWPDPVDPLCPNAFRITARSQMLMWAREHAGHLGSESYEHFLAYKKNPALLEDHEALRNALLDFIADFSNWDNATVPEYLATSHELTRVAHESLGGIPGTRPLVADPFAGGGAIPLEALRVGADSYATDLNPVPILLNKVVQEFIPAFGRRLGEEVRKWGDWMQTRMCEDLAAYYPKDKNGDSPICYLWARTIQCEGPECGATVPLMRSLWLAKKPTKATALQLMGDVHSKKIHPSLITRDRSGWFEHGKPNQRVSTPTLEGTVKRGSATCPCCGYTTPVARVREQLKARSGGAKDCQLMAVVTTRIGESGRSYRVPTPLDIEVYELAVKDLQRAEDSHTGPTSLVPNEVLPLMSGVFNVPIYGHTTWGSIFTPRQLLSLTTLAKLVREAGVKIESEFDPAFAKAVRTCLALVLDRQANALSALSRWHQTGEKIEGVFSRQALGMVWDFAEANPLSASTGGLSGSIEWVEKVCSACADANLHGGTVQQASATNHPLPDDSVKALVTDPPYYNAVPYADLSDFFYVWLKRVIGEDYPDLFSQPLSPKADEACEMAGWDPIRYPHKNAKWFEQQMQSAMAEGRRILAPDGIGIVVFAHKSTAGWEAQLQAMLDAGWIVTGSWPIDTEMGARLRARDSAALASSVHLVCRPRENSDGSLRCGDIGDWREVLQELPRRIHEWMPRLADEGVVGADAIFACLGPAIEVFSRFSQVEKASGEVVPLREYLEQVWAAVSREALSMIFQGANTEGFEPDARLTAMWLWTLSTADSSDSDSGTDDEVEDEESEGASKKKVTGFLLDYDAARKIAQGLGAALDSLTSLVSLDGDTAKLLSVSERAAYLFGKESVQPASPRPRGRQRQEALPGFEEIVEEVTGFGLAGGTKAKLGQTVLDRVHQAMLLFGAGRSEAMKVFLVDEGVGQDARFWRLAQAFSALYPRDTQEKRWVDGVLARKKGLGF